MKPAELNPLRSAERKPNERKLMEWLRAQARPSQIAIFFEDYNTLRTGLALYGKIINNPWDHETECAWWELGTLANPIIAREASKSASEAGLIVFSIYAERELTKPAKEWIDSFFSQPQQLEKPVVIVVEGETPATLLHPPTVTFLEDRVIQAHNRLFTHFLHTPEDFSPDKIALRANTVTGVLTDILSQTRGCPHWGINE